MNELNQNEVFSNEVVTGSIVISKQGRDKGKWFVVLHVARDDNTRNGEYAWLTDGRLRPVDKPKKKKLMHIKPTKYTDETLKHKIETKQMVLDSEVRHAICQFRGIGRRPKAGQARNDGIDKEG